MIIDQRSVGLFHFGNILKIMKKRYIKSAQLKKYLIITVVLSFFVSCTIKDAEFKMKKRIESI